MGFVSDLISAVKQSISLRKDVENVFEETAVISQKMQDLIPVFNDITSGEPGWLDPEDDTVHSISMASYIDNFTAGLVCLNLEVNVSGGSRGEQLQKNVDYLMAKIVDNVADALGNVGIMFKPNGENIDYIQPGYFVPLETNSNGDILGCAFKTERTIGKNHYTKWEMHRFEKRGDSKIYKITNKAYKSENPDKLGDECSLSEVDDWADLDPVVIIENIDKPLYAYFGMPMPNNVDRQSPLSLPIWYGCIEELACLDYAWSRKSAEVDDSRHTTFVPSNAIKYAEQENIKLPRYIEGIEMGMGNDTIHDHVVQLLTEQRIRDINSILAMISAKCGFSQSTFKLDEKTGLMTATQVEADDQETIRTIKTIRDRLKTAIDQTIYACNVMLDNRGETPSGTYKVDYEWGDITYNYKEDRAMWLSYVDRGWIKPERYLEKFEGMTEEEAAQYVKEAKEALTADQNFNVSEAGGNEAGGNEDADT